MLECNQGHGSQGHWVEGPQRLARPTLGSLVHYSTAFKIKTFFLLRFALFQLQPIASCSAFGEESSCSPSLCLLCKYVKMAYHILPSSPLLQTKHP